MASFRNLLGLPVKLWDNRAAGQVLQLSSDKEHWEFGTGGGGGTASPLTTKGDLYGYGTDNARLPVGTDGQVLVADSTKALGVKWAEGNGIHIDDRVSTYANLPSPPTEGTGATYLVDADGLLYVWDGSSWPADGEGEAMSSSAMDNAGASVSLLTTGTGVVPTKAATFLKTIIGGITLFIPAYRVIAITTASTISIPSTGSGSITLAATGGATPYTWSLTSGTLPTGVTLDASFATNGKINYDGTQTVGDTQITVQVTDATSKSDSASLTLSIVQVTVTRWWRLYVTSAQPGSFVQAGELQFRATPGGTSLCTGGTAFASSVFPDDGGGPYTADKAFDGTHTTLWSSSTAAPQFVGYYIPSNSSVDEIMLQARSTGTWSTVSAWVPRDFIIQSSTDSTTGVDGTWNDEWSVTGQTGWSPGEVRTFTRP